MQNKKNKKKLLQGNTGPSWGLFRNNDHLTEHYPLYYERENLNLHYFFVSFYSFLFQIDQSQAFLEHLWCRQPVIREYLQVEEEVLSWRHLTSPMSSSRMLGKASSRRQRLNVITHSPLSSPHIPKTGLASLRLVYIYIISSKSTNIWSVHGLQHSGFHNTGMLYVRKRYPSIPIYSLALPFMLKFNLALNQEEMSARKVYILLRYNNSLWLVLKALQINQIFPDSI